MFYAVILLKSHGGFDPVSSGGSGLIAENFSCMEFKNNNVSICRLIQAWDITIAITVFHRREYVLEAIRRSLEQTVSVSVMVVEDCTPDRSMQAFIQNEFGDRIRYFKNPVIWVFLTIGTPV